MVTWEELDVNFLANYPRKDKRAKIIEKIINQHLGGANFVSIYVWDLNDTIIKELEEKGFLVHSVYRNEVQVWWDDNAFCSIEE